MVVMSARTINRLASSRDFMDAKEEERAVPRASHAINLGRDKNTASLAMSEAPAASATGSYDGEVDLASGIIHGEAKPNMQGTHRQHRLSKLPLVLLWPLP